MYKKIFLFFIFLIITMANLNPLIIIKRSDETDTSYIKETYGEWTEFSAEQMLKGEFDEFVRLATSGIIQDSSLSDDNKESQIKQLKALKFERFKFVFFSVKTAMPVLGKYLRFKFKLSDANGNNLIQDINYFSFRQIWVGTYGGGEIFNYYWVIETNTPLHRKNIGKENQPVLLEIEFPNGKKLIYEAKI